MHEQLHLFLAAVCLTHERLWPIMHVLVFDRLIIEQAGGQVGLRSFTDFARGTKVCPQDARASLELQAFMHVAPVEAAAVNRLVGIRCYEETARRLAESDQQAQYSRVKVLRLVYDNRVVALICNITCHKRLCTHAGLLPGLYTDLLELLHIRVVDTPDSFFL